MSTLDDLLHDLVIANRILAHEGVVDAFGHVSVRHPERPDRFFLSCSRSPELVTIDDIVEYDLECRPVVDQQGREQYAERPIHGAIYQARPDIQAIVHNHAYDVIPFSVSRNVKLKPMITNAAHVGGEVPVWDMRDKFGDTNLLVVQMAHGHDLATCLGQGRAALMRAHGCVVASETLYNVVHSSIYLMVNARLQSEAMRFGDPIYLSEGEIELIGNIKHTRKSRGWEYWKKRAGAMDL